MKGTQLIDGIVPDFDFDESTIGDGIGHNIFLDIIALRPLSSSK